MEASVSFCRAMPIPARFGRMTLGRGPPTAAVRSSKRSEIILPGNGAEDGGAAIGGKQQVDIDPERRGRGDKAAIPDRAVRPHRNQKRASVVRTHDRQPPPPSNVASKTSA